MCNIHRLVALAFITNPLNLPQVDHIDGKKLNCHVSNLRWATGTDNIKAAYDLGLIKTGEDRSDAKLTSSQVLYIRDNPDGLTQDELAEKLNVDQTTISLIQLGKSYKNVGGFIRESKCRRISNEERAAIKAERAAGLPVKAIAAKHNIHQGTVSRILHEDD